MAGRFVEATVIHITLSYSDARTVAVGDGVEIGDTVGISQSRHHFAANAAAEIVVAMPGVSRYDDVTKDAGTVWAVGDKLYWDQTDKNWTKTASGNALGAIARAAATSAATTGSILHAPIIQT